MLIDRLLDFNLTSAPKFDFLNLANAKQLLHEFMQ